VQQDIAIVQLMLLWRCHGRNNCFWW